jgi:hypothetical protein
MIEFKDVWTVSIVLLGFQVAAFTWRLGREISVGRDGDITWFPPAEMLNMFAILVNCLGVFVLPLTRLASESASYTAFGISVILFAGFPVALAGHYDLFTLGDRSMEYFTRQERIAVGLTLLMIIAFLVLRVY